MLDMLASTAKEKNPNWKKKEIKKVRENLYVDGQFFSPRIPGFPQEVA